MTHRLSQLHQQLSPSFTSSNLDSSKLEPISIPLSETKSIYGVQYISKEQSENRINILALHGFLDCWSSFLPLFNHFEHQMKDFRFVAIDFVGHGKSDHVTELSYLHQLEAIQAVFDWAKWEKCIIVGHSYGGNNALFYTAACPQKVQALIMIESWGPVTINLEDTAKKMGLGFEERSKYRQKPPKVQKFKSLNEAVTKVHSSLSKESPIKISSIETLLKENLKQVIDSNNEVSFTWRYDYQAKLRNLVSPSEEQVVEVIKSIECGVLMIEGDKGFLKTRYSSPTKSKQLDNRKKSFKNLKLIVLEDQGHYLHMDVPNLLAHLILEFISTQS